MSVLGPFYLSVVADYPKGPFYPSVYENYVIDLKIDDHLIELELWETYANEDFTVLRPLSYPGAAVVVLAFAIDSRESFEHVGELWYPEILHFCATPKPPIVLVGCKSDVRARRSVALNQGGLFTEVTMEEGRVLANRIRAVGYLECSSKAGEGISEALELIARTAISWDPLAIPKRENKCLVV